MKIRSIAAAVSLALIWASSSFAGVAEGIAAYEDRKPRQAFVEFIRDARRGDDESKYLAALMYIEGKGVKRSYWKARYWLRRVSPRSDFPGVSSMMEVAKLRRITTDIRSEIASLILGRRSAASDSGLPPQAATDNRRQAPVVVQEEKFDLLQDNSPSVLSAENGQLVGSTNSPSLKLDTKIHGEVPTLDAVKPPEEQVSSPFADMSIDEATRLAQGGNADASFNLAFKFIIGEGVAPDLAKGKMWLEVAAKQGSEAAKGYLVSVWADEFDESGQPRAQFVADLSTPAREFAPAASTVPPPASELPSVSPTTADIRKADEQYALAVKYLTGTGVTKDISVALGWLEKAAAQEHGKTLLLLGQMFFTGDDVPQDLELARHWYGVAAAKGDAEAAYRLGLLWEKGYGVEKDLSIAASWYKKAAVKKHVNACSVLSSMYATGRGVGKDYAAAAALAKVAAERNDPVGQFNLGVLYQKGSGVPQSYKEAVSWYEKAAKQKHARAMNNLGYMAQLGLGSPADPVAAHKWFNLAALAGEELAIEHRAALEQTMTLDQINAAQSQAITWAQNDGEPLPKVFTMSAPKLKQPAPL